MSNISVSESGNYFYIMQGDSDADCWPQHKEAKSPKEEIIIKLCEKILSYEQERQGILDFNEAWEQHMAVSVNNGLYIVELEAEIERLKSK